ncbi:FAD-dependent 5-carboxymethylaminomethyl-2-thiouridine(34) oxidoreductase MnmC [uncultured Shewanella sp.]|uniref:FAD-dependent 5-carboxymethylaminomethyl-2-thiouridine(34) oxidoreductase MnmC n=1 Tax=uncultured Shewanella sp. TaxID=173975 RepID=UPI002631A602|nr:FAD-dependent 5-carboxymethylaminomethyl-2-thiouridine(34) oxidoreductase MnmC [uncultured Shewanella sp.]
MTVSSLYQYVKTTKTDNSPIVLGQIGMSAPKTWLTLLAEHQKSNAHMLIIKTFIPHASDMLGNAPQQAIEFFIQSQPSLAPYIDTTLNTKLINIHGIQRLSLNNDQLILDFHIGELKGQIEEMLVFQQTLISHWYSENTQSLFHINQSQLWQMAKISQDTAPLLFIHSQGQTEHPSPVQVDFQKRAKQAGFQCLALANNTERQGRVDIDQQINTHSSKSVDKDIASQERQALRYQQAIHNNPFPLMGTKEDPIAIIGGGIASAHLALSLANRQRKLHLFCKDPHLASQASGNKQGALYPLLTPENNTLSQYFQQAFLYSRRRLEALQQSGFNIAHDLCGVLHTGFDERSQARITKILTGHAWDPNIARSVDKQLASQLAGIPIDKSGIFYPQGGWVCPEDYTLAAMNKAMSLTHLELHLNCHIDRLEQKDNQWYLYQGEQEYGPFASVVLANGHALTQFTQTKTLQLSGFRGQVSHIPSKGQLSELQTVLCAHGYLTPKYQQTHCVGASYVKNAADLNFCPQEQRDNLNKMHHSYPNQPWVDDIDVSDNDARVGVRMVTRDHAPMMGPVPDVEQLLARYEQHQLTPESRQYWQNTPAPIHQGLYVLGGLGSRGLSSGPLAAEALAAMICEQPLPINQAALALLSPNRMWMRKLLKGKAL